MEHSVVTVFGGTGFLGREIVRRLATAGRTVRVAARHPAMPEDLAQDQAIARLVELWTADVRDSASVAQAVEGATCVINAVSLYVEPRGGPTFDEVHVQGARRVAQSAREAGVGRLIHVSGVGASPASRSKYVRARGRGEQRVRETFPDATVLRPTVLFGRGDDFLSTLDMVTRMPVVPLFGAGDIRLQPVHVGDIAAAAERMSALPNMDGRVFELGGSAIYRYRDIVRMVLAQRKRRRPLVNMPFGAWKGLARAASILPSPPLTVDQVILMQMDNITSDRAERFDELGIEPRSLEAALAESLDA